VRLGRRLFRPGGVQARPRGTLTKLAVAEGDVVQEGDLIAVIE